MADHDIVLCPICNEPMVPSFQDGATTLDGSVDLSGLKCPKCSTSVDIATE